MVAQMHRSVSTSVAHSKLAEQVRPTNEPGQVSYQQQSIRTYRQ
jgi:hypothetical protein